MAQRHWNSGAGEGGLEPATYIKKFLSNEIIMQKQLTET